MTVLLRAISGPPARERPFPRRNGNIALNDSRCGRLIRPAGVDPLRKFGSGDHRAKFMMLAIKVEELTLSQQAKPLRRHPRYENLPRYP
jgi:hypothetical protein